MPTLLAAARASAALALLALPVAAAAASESPSVQRVEITILRGDRVTGSNVALAPGQPVRVTVTNDTDEFHTFTAPGLGVSELVYPAHGSGARQTTFTFTPERWGSFPWRCAICPSGMHGPPHAMGGTLYVIVNPSALP